MKVEIVYDHDYDSPQDSFCKLYCWHKRYTIGEKHNYDNPKECMEALADDGLCGYVYMYYHGQKSLSCQPFNCQLDSGVLGVWHISAKDLAEFPDEESARRYVTSFLDTCTDYLNGNVFGVKIVDDKICDCCGQTMEDEVDSCYGFYGSDHVKSGLFGFVAEVLGDNWQNECDLEECWILK